MRTDTRPYDGPRGRRLAAIAISLAIIGGSFALVGPTASGADVVFADGFETGTFGAWSSTSGMTIQQQTVHGGTRAAANTTSIAWAERRFVDPRPQLSAELWFRFAQRSGAVWLARLRTSTGTPLMKVLVNANGKLAYRNDVSAVTRTSPVSIVTERWYLLTVDVRVGSPGRVDVALDGAPIPSLGWSESLGTAPIGRFEIGHRPTGTTYSVAFDDVVVSDPAAVGTPLPPIGLTATSVSGGSVALDWEAPSSGPAPAVYRVYRDNLEIGQVTADTTAFTDLAAPERTRVVYTAVSESANGATSAPAPSLVVPTSGFDPAVDTVIYATGDIACVAAWATTPTTCRERETSDIPVAGAGDAVIVLGDNQYEQGTLAQFMASYDPTWGRVKSITFPTPGNHEYKTAGAAGYFSYFGARAGDPSRGFYAAHQDAWDVLALNSNCGSIGGCGSASAQFSWLSTELTRSAASGCTLAVWHHPRFSSGEEHGSDSRTQAMWSVLAREGADIVLQGHEHNYERFVPMNSTGGPSSSGMRSFVVGTGGKSLYGFAAPLATSAVRHSSTFGVLKLTLHDGWYSWNFVPEWGGTFADAGTGDCH